MSLKDRWQCSSRFPMVYSSLLRVSLYSLVWIYHLDWIYFCRDENSFSIWANSDDLNWFKFNWIYCSWTVCHLFSCEIVCLSLWHDVSFWANECEIDWTSVSQGYSLHEVGCGASWCELICCWRHLGHKGLAEGD